MINKIIDLFTLLIIQPDFIVEINDMIAKAKSGKMTNNFLIECTEYAQSKKIRAGKIYGIKNENEIRLKFSLEIPEIFHQGFRNIWNIYK